MKKHLFLKSLLVAIGLLVTGLTSLVWAYNCNYANVYYDNSVTQWTYVQLLYENSSGSTGWNMSHVAHTDLYWKAPGAWSDNNFSGVRFADGTSGDWPWSTENSWTRTGNQKKECTGFFGGDIANNVHLFTCNIKTYDASKVNIGHPYYGSNPTMLNKTVNVGSKTKVGNNDFSASVASVAAISMKHYSFNSSTYASVQDYYSSNVPTHPKGSTSTYTIYPTYTSNVTYSFSNLTSGYEFVGWYDGEGNLLSNDEEYTKYTTSGYDVYAYFAQTHTVTFGKEGSGTVSPSGNQTIGQNGVTITASSPSTGYYFAGWTCTGGASVEDASATSTKVTATATGTVTANFKPIWYLKGDFNSWGESNPISLASSTSGSVDLVTTSANISNSKFKIWNKQTDKYYQISNASVTRANPTPSGSWTEGGTDNDMKFNSDIIDTYRFNVTFSSNTPSALSVTYPTPTYDIHYYDQGGTTFTGTHGSGYPTTHTYNTATALVSPTKTGYTFDGWFANSSCTGGALTSLGATAYTDDITLYAKWTAKTYTVALDQEDGTGGLDEIEDVTYGAAMPTIASKDLPSKSNYTFGGYYDGEGGTGTPYYNANGTSAKAWDKDVADPTLYAKWTENTYTVTFANDGHGSTTPTGSQSVGVVTGVAISATPNDGYEFDEWTSSDGGTFTSAATSASNTFKPTANTTVTAKFKIMTYNGTIDKSTDAVGATDGSYSVTYGATTLTATDPEKAGYHVSGYFLDEDCETKIADEEGNLRAKVSIGDDKYTNNDGEWIWNGQPKLYVSWAANTITITLNRNDGSGTTTTTSVSMGTSVYTPAVSALDRAGYDFLGYYTEEAGGTRVFKDNGDTDSDASTYIGTYSSWIYPNNITLYAHWEEVELTFDNGDGDNLWSNASNWDPACVPTSAHDVTISAEATVSGSAVAKSVTINQSTGKLTIASTGTLDVIGTISNANEEKLEVMAGGALIFDYSSAPSAKVHHSVSGSSTYRYIALPISYVHVSSAFSGKDVYTFVWNEGSGWERRGYYDDISGNEPIAISGQSSWTFYGTLVNALFGSVANTSGDYAGTNMYANSWTAPIKISGVTISGNADKVVYTDNNGSWTANTANGTGSAVIPAMSAFVILANGAGGGSVSIPYNTAVRNVAVSPASAPRRMVSDDIQNHITMNVTGNELRTNLRLYENGVFTNEFDNGWEARFLEGDGRAGQLYTQTDDKMVILATPDLEGTVVGFIPGEAANYTISFEGDGKGYYLNDLDMQESTLIEEGNTYVFTPNESSNATRFVISKTPIHKTTTGNDAIYDVVKARKQMIDGVLYIIRDGRMYNAEGMLVK